MTFLGIQELLLPLLLSAETQIGYLVTGWLFWLPLLAIFLLSSRMLLAPFGAERLFWEERLAVQFGSLLFVGLYTAVSGFIWRLVDEPSRTFFAISWIENRLGRFPSLAHGTENRELYRTGQHLLVFMTAFGLMLIIQKIWTAWTIRDAAERSLFLLARRYFIPGILGYLTSMLVVWGFSQLNRSLEKQDLVFKLMEWTGLFQTYLSRATNSYQAPTEDTYSVSGKAFEGLKTYHIPHHETAGLLILISSVILVIVIVLAITIRCWFPRRVLGGPVVTVCQVGIILVQSAGFMSFHVIAPATVLIGVIIWLIVTNRQSLRWAKFRFPGMENLYETPSPLKDYPHPIPEGSKPDLIPDRELLLQHLERLPNGKKRVVLLAVSGGGIRAAVWVPIVMQGLRTLIPGFDQHVRLITGASGGMVGAALDVACQSRKMPEIPKNYASVGLGVVSGLTAEQSLLPVVQTLFLRDLFLNIAWPYSWPYKWRTNERGRELEEQWSLAAKELFPEDNPWEVTFAKLATLEKVGKIPSLIFTPVIVEDTRRVIISNLDLEHVAKSGGPRLGTEGTDYSRSSIELFKILPTTQTEMPLRTAARMNATFPIVSPNVSLPTTPAARLMDAGMYDNYGVEVLSDWLMHHRHDLINNADGVLIIEVRAFPLEKEGNGFRDSDSTSLLGILMDSLSIITNSVRALITGRGSIMYHRNNTDMASLGETFSDVAVQKERKCDLRPVKDFFQTAVIELDEDASLNWYLSGVEKQAIAGAWSKPQYQEIVQRIGAWLNPS
jgi:hypothetical protein